MPSNTLGVADGYRFTAIASEPTTAPQTSPNGKNTVGINAAGQSYVDDNGTVSIITVLNYYVGPTPVTTGVVPVAVNNNGEVVGHYFGHEMLELGFIYSNGQTTTLRDPGVPGGPVVLATDPEAINNRGEVAGNFLGTDLISHGFVYDHGRYTTIDVPGALQTEISSVSNSGVVYGKYETASDVWQDFKAMPVGGHG